MMKRKRTVTPESKNSASLVKGEKVREQSWDIRKRVIAKWSLHRSFKKRGGREREHADWQNFDYDEKTKKDKTVTDWEGGEHPPKT